MKRYGHLFSKICDIHNIMDAVNRASLGKKHHRKVAKYLKQRKITAYSIQYLLENHLYVPHHVKDRHIIEDCKDRIITSAPYFPDQIIHWATMNVLSPIFMKSMYPYCLATVPNRGGILGKRKLAYWLRNDVHNTKYCLKTDIHHFYPSIDHHILKVKLTHRFKDKQVLDLLFSIIDCYPNGLPLGMYTSQWFANFFLEKLDHKIKEELHVPYYIRYMDDQVFLGPNKKKLHKVEQCLDKWLKNLNLQLKPNWYIAPVDKRFIDFLGFKFYRGYTTLRKRDYLHIKREAHYIYNHHLTYHLAKSMMSYWGWIINSNSYRFYRHDVEPYCSFNKCKKYLHNKSHSNK